MRVARKVLVYATSDRGLLVFDEPAFPDLPLQVPGGTIEPGESAEAAARREFLEETGLRCEACFRLLGEQAYAFEKNGSPHRHLRSFFHIELPSTSSETWEHHEQTPDGGGAPILFRLFWLDLKSAQRRLGFGMGELIDRILA